LDQKTSLGDLAPVVGGGLLIVFSMWWIYFDMPAERVVAGVRDSFSERLRGAFSWGYGHYVVFGAAAAVGAGLAVGVDQIAHHSQLSDLAAAFAVTGPVAAYVVTVWLLHVR